MGHRLVVAATCALLAGCAGGMTNVQEDVPVEAAPHACPEGFHSSAGHCCPPGTEWVAARYTCVCLDLGMCASEEGADILDQPHEGEEEAPEEAPRQACAAGAERPADAGGGCCPDGTHWATPARECRQSRTCEDGAVAAGPTCARVGAAGRWVAIGPTTFRMGSPEAELRRFDDEAIHEVTLTRWTLMRATEVTQADFEAAMGYNPSRFSDCGECPVERVTWNEAAAYCNVASRAEGLPSCYECSGEGPQTRCEPAAAFRSTYDCPGYRLPTEAEWEAAARAGTSGPSYDEPLHEIAYFRGNSLERTHPVGQLRPNAWGLYDMLGNVMEWCHDWYSTYPEEPVEDPQGPADGEIRVLRGGSWLINDWRVRAAYRYRGAPELRVGNAGFRPVRTVIAARRRDDDPS